MSKYFRLIFAFFFIMLSLPLSLQAQDIERSHDRQQLKKILYDIENSLNTLDMDGLLKHFDERAVVSFMTTEVAVGKAGILAYYQKMFHLPEAPLAAFHTKASLDGAAYFHGDTIIASGHSKDSFTLTDDRQYEFNTRWLATAIKKDGQWKVVALDFSVDPFNNVIIDELGSQMKFYLLLAFLLGLLVMFILSRMLFPHAKKATK